MVTWKNFSPAQSGARFCWLTDLARPWLPFRCRLLSRFPFREIGAFFGLAVTPRAGAFDLLGWIDADRANGAPGLFDDAHADVGIGGLHFHPRFIAIEFSIPTEHLAIVAELAAADLHRKCLPSNSR